MHTYGEVCSSINLAYPFPYRDTSAYLPSEEIQVRHGGQATQQQVPERGPAEIACGSIG